MPFDGFTHWTSDLEPHNSRPKSRLEKISKDKKSALLKIPQVSSLSKENALLGGASAPVETVGRYIEADPTGFGGGLNLYGYVNQNPLRGVDPSGLIENPLELTCVDPAQPLCALGVAADLLSDGYGIYRTAQTVSQAINQRNAANDNSTSSAASAGTTTGVGNPACPDDYCKILYTELTSQKAELISDLDLLAPLNGNISTPTMGTFQMSTVQLIRQVNEAIEEYNQHCSPRIDPIPLGPQGVVE